MKLRLRGPSLPQTPPKRGVVTEFSNSSRRRMIQLMAQTSRDALPHFITLTYPDSMPTYREEFKGHLESFAHRILRRWPKAAIVWKLEFKVRQSGENMGKIAPHYHLFLYEVPWEFPMKIEVRQWFRCYDQFIHTKDDKHWTAWYREVSDKDSESTNYCQQQVSIEIETADGTTEKTGDTLKDWVSRHWYDVVGTGDGRHFRAGTRVEQIETFRQVSGYAAKRYVAKQEDIDVLPEKPGRFWGVIGRKNLPLVEPKELVFTEAQLVQLRRVFRRYRRANTPPEKRRFIDHRQFRDVEFTVNAYCDASYWLERIPKLVGDALREDQIPRPPSPFGDYLKAMAERLRTEQATKPTTPPPAPVRTSFRSWLEETCPED